MASEYRSSTSPANCAAAILADWQVGRWTELQTTLEWTRRDLSAAAADSLEEERSDLLRAVVDLLRRDLRPDDLRCQAPRMSVVRRMLHHVAGRTVILRPGNYLQ